MVEYAITTVFKCWSMLLLESRVLKYSSTVSDALYIKVQFSNTSVLQCEIFLFSLLVDL